jgi:hypothetical protein
MQRGCSEIAPQLGVLTFHPTNCFVGQAALAGADEELGPQLLDRRANVDIKRSLRLSRLIEAQ